MNKDDFGINGVHVFNTLLPFAKTPTVNYSMKLFEIPTPIDEMGVLIEWNADCPVDPPCTMIFLSLSCVTTHLKEAAKLGELIYSSLIMVVLIK